MPVATKPKRKLTPFEKLEKTNKAHINATRKVMAKLRAELRALEGNTELELVLKHYDNTLRELDLADISLRRGHTLYLAANKYA